MTSVGIVDVTGTEQTYSYLVQQWCYDWDGYPYDCSYWDTAYDTGTLYLAIGGYSTSISYGPGNNAHNLAYWLAYQINSDPSSPVNAEPIDPNSNVHTLYLTSKATGQGANYQVTTNAVSDGGNVSPPSFGFSPPSFYMTGGH
jgi:phage tail sheath gpL-like